jgi:L-ascorbate metabolism protein UlaG (beta-lactamase superfamily)
MSLWASFVIDAPGGRIYFVADSGYDDGGRFRDARERFHSLANLASANCAGLQPADAPRRG